LPSSLSLATKATDTLYEQTMTTPKAATTAEEGTEEVSHPAVARMNAETIPSKGTRVTSKVPEEEEEGTRSPLEALGGGAPPEGVMTVRVGRALRG
jgi:hypothetical protein